MEVNLTKRIDTAEGRRYCPAIIAANGRVKRNWVLVNGKPEKHEFGSYYLEWREEGRRKRLSVGTDSDLAHQRQLRKLAELRALHQGLVVRDLEEDAGKDQVKLAVHEFLEEVKLTRQEKTWRGYEVALKYFQESCDKKNVEAIQRIDLLRFSAFLRDKKKLAPRTVHNKFACVLTFLESQGLSKLVGKKDRPRFVDQEVEIYEDGELPILYSACSLYHRTLYDFLLMTGFREQEAMYVTWANVHFRTNTIDMRWKPQFNWTPKAYKEREVPVPDSLLETLALYRKALPASRAHSDALVFSTRSGKPDIHMIRALKRNAKKAGLNREHFWLHKFRATFATMHLQAEVDLRTVMTWMGQTNLESIIRYLKPARHQTVRQKVNTTLAKHGAAGIHPMEGTA